MASPFSNTLHLALKGTKFSEIFNPRALIRKLAHLKEWKTGTLMGIDANGVKYFQNTKDYMHSEFRRWLRPRGARRTPWRALPPIISACRSEYRSEYALHGCIFRWGGGGTLVGVFGPSDSLRAQRYVLGVILTRSRAPVSLYRSHGPMG